MSRYACIFLLLFSCTAFSRADIEHTKDKPADEYSQLVSHFDYTIPKPKHIQPADKVCLVGKKAQLDIPVSFAQQYPAIISSFAQTLTYFGQAKGQEPGVRFNAGIKTTAINKPFIDALKKNGAYNITVNCQEVIISANNNEGFINGITTLESMIATHKGALRSGTIIDYPATKVRALHLSLWPTSTLNFQKAIKRARFGHYNTLILQPAPGVKLQSLSHLATNNAWSVQQFREMVAYTHSNGLELIPELKLLSHQIRFLAQKHPELLYNKSTYDPRQPELYKKVVFPAIDEILLLTGARKFHIGHDEVMGWKDKHFEKGLLNKGDTQLPPELFFQDILTLYFYLADKKIEVWMWGDMLLSGDEFPLMKNYGDLNGYYRYNLLRGKIPKEIVINDWHYRGEQTEFPTALAFAKLGHKVLGATWENTTTTRNFTRYINRMPINNEGMIATTWYGLTDKNSQVHDIITQSAEVFWNE